MSQSTYYTCNGCDHATFKIAEALEHFGQFGGRHTFDFNGPLVFKRFDWARITHSFAYGWRDRGF